MKCQSWILGIIEVEPKMDVSSEWYPTSIPTPAQKPKHNNRMYDWKSEEYRILILSSPSCNKDNQVFYRSGRYACTDALCCPKKELKLCCSIAIILVVQGFIHKMVSSKCSQFQTLLFFLVQESFRHLVFGILVLLAFIARYGGNLIPINW